MTRISVSALQYMTRMAKFHCKFSAAFYILPKEVNDDNERTVQQILDLISDYADFIDQHIINLKMHPASSKSDSTFTVIDILRTKLTDIRNRFLTRQTLTKNVNIVVLEP